MRGQEKRNETYHLQLQDMHEKNPQIRAQHCQEIEEFAPPVIESIDSVCRDSKNGP